MFFEDLANFSLVLGENTWIKILVCEIRQTLKGSSIIIDTRLIYLPTILYRLLYHIFNCMNIQISSCLNSPSHPQECDRLPEVEKSYTVTLPM